VRDVADLHLRAMANPAANGQRFIGMAGGTLSLPQIAGLLKKEMPDIAQKVTTRVLPDWVIRVSALFSPQAKSAASLLGISRNVSNEKAKQILGWKPLANNEQAILASVGSMQRFAYMTGRSISAFKRDFKQIFNDTPNHWLVQKRLQEAHFLIEKQAKKPSEIYFDLGFKDLSHFSFAFKKQFGLAPTEIARSRAVK